jgi:hypothetical protein
MKHFFDDCDAIIIKSEYHRPGAGFPIINSKYGTLAFSPCVISTKRV